ncbi:MAG: hypothetical protein GQ574_22685 [Crocinitomix sp.]|nr:hypothetical protein [Crocinitomix sp.]
MLDLNLKFSKYYGIALFLVIISSCTYSDGDWGATVGNCDEICAVYYSAELELRKNKKLKSLDFPNEEIRRAHVKEIENGHSINSWFTFCNEKSDTITNKFSCEVYYDMKKIGYVVKNLEIIN